MSQRSKMVKEKRGGNNIKASTNKIATSTLKLKGVTSEKWGKQIFTDK